MVGVVTNVEFEKMALEILGGKDITAGAFAVYRSQQIGSRPAEGATTIAHIRCGARLWIASKRRIPAVRP